MSADYTTELADKVRQRLTNGNLLNSLLRCMKNVQTAQSLTLEGSEYAESVTCLLDSVALELELLATLAEEKGAA